MPAEQGEREASEANRQTVETLLSELGIDGRPELDWQGARYTGDVVVSTATLRKLASDA